MKIAALTIQNTHSLISVQHSKKIFQIDAELSIKLACAFISMFNSSIRITTDKMNEFDIYECADLFVRKYTHESISDMALCLRMVKSGELGIIYNRFDTQTFFQFFEKYLEYKWKTFDENHFDEMANLEGSFNRPEHSISIVAERVKLKKQQRLQEKNAKDFEQIYNENKQLVKSNE